MNVIELNIRDKAVQDFLWKYLVPSDFRDDYNKLDAIKFVESECYAGSCRLFGNMETQFMFRCTVRNSKVLEPHIMGEGKVLREAFSAGINIAWMMGFERVSIWTHHKRIATICKRLKFTQHGLMPKFHMVNGVLHDLYCLSITKDEQCDTSTNLANLTTTSMPSRQTLLAS